MKHLQPPFFITIAFFIISFTATAQTPYKRSAVIKELKSAMKEAAYSKVVSRVGEAIETYSDQAGCDAEIFYYNVQATNALALEEAKKMYLGQSADTMRYFDYIQTVFTDGLRCDSLGNIPDKKGRVANRYHKELTALFLQNMNKLPSAAKFSFQKKDYTRAFRFADTYIALNADTSAWSLQILTGEAATELSAMAGFTLLAAYALQDYSGAVRHVELALAPSTRRRKLLEIVCRCYEELGETSKLEQYLKDGVKTYPTDKFFFFSLTKLYNDQGRYDEALQLTDTMLKLNDKNRDFWYIRGKEEEYLGRADDALKSYGMATELKIDDAESFAAIGNIYLNKSHKVYDQQKSAVGAALQNIKQELHSLYTKSKEAFERARQHDAANTSLWLSGLRELYYKLNMGKELKEIESVK